MARKRRDNSDSIVDSLLVLPWWFSVGAAAIALPALHFGGAAMMAAGGSLTTIGRIFQFGAIPAAIGLLLIAGGAALHSRRKRALAQQALTLEGRAALSPREFEFAVTELLASRGYATEENLAGGADGGIDIRAWRQSELFLVQCKHWRNRFVGVNPVRELLGVVTSCRAKGGILVCSGDFTREAREFARGQPIELIDGGQLAAFAGPPKPSHSAHGHAVSAAAASAGAPPCPRCGGAMIMRTARRGTSAGDSFWGCRSYPSCRGTKSLA